MAAGLPELEALVLRLISLSVRAALIVVLIMLIVAGFKYLTSGGDAKTLGQAQQTITWALLGILFMAIAWLILMLIEAFTGARVTQFCLSINGC